jgi:NAD(P)H-hydrate epimerase
LVDICGAVILLKGPRTLIGAPGELPAVQRTDAPALATAGAGDVLTGIISAFACALSPRWATCCGAYVHGRAAERWAARVVADRGLLSHEVADEVPHALAELRAGLPR